MYMSLNLSTIRNAVYNLGGIVQPASGVEENLLPDIQANFVKGRPVDEGFIPVSPPQFGLNLASFGAVTSHTFLIAEIGGNGILIPLHYSNIAAVILLRETGYLRQALTPLLESYLLVPMNKVPNTDAVHELAGYGIPFLDTECDSDAFEEMRRSAYRRAKHAAVELISRQILGWRGHYGGEGQVVGIAGTYDDILPDVWGADILTISDASSVLASEAEGFVGSLPLGHMTHPFEVDDGRRYFYLRLRDNTLKDPGYGLIRIEFMPTEGVGDVDYAKALAFYILRERIPVNPAWKGNSNQIYPLTACLNYMTDFIASPETVNAYFGRRE